ncbi:hypothetical protein JF539_09495 [Labrenzia aggregata]|uniref:Uncharacterized protein n=2 Tax=Roseibium aggregatum TaxID=187304 RepID=A0A939EFF4_9HYPH|nr:hypothetical protein [Roseibium aggregatum]
MRFFCLLALALVSIKPVLAGEVKIVDATARQQGGSWTFSVTLLHEDEGWDHYADLWQVLGPDGAVLGERVLLHPHENEQPFTRSLSGVVIPDGVGSVRIRARDKKHGFSDKTFEVSLDR